MAKLGGSRMLKRKAIRCLLKSWLAPGLCLIGLGMVLSILVPFWVWVLIGGIGLICYGAWSFFC